MTTVDQSERSAVEADRYDARTVEAKWQKWWEDTGLYRTDLRNATAPFFNLMEFPYPSGEGLHVGHVYTYCGADTYGRLKKMQGADVFQPMGFDSFGIHAENYALKLGINPARLTDQTVRRFRETQMRRLGTMWDWSHEVVTSHPDYYRWTQWVFLQMWKAGLAYRATAPVTWCPSCLTVLANEQTEQVDGVAVCERCSTPVEQREMEQWFFRITRYADRLVDGLRDLDWPETSKFLQAEWIGRSRGAEITFTIAESDRSFVVFTTRPDTLFGATYCVLAPEHPLVEAITTPVQRAAVQSYRAQTAAKTEQERAGAGGTRKTGVFTGAHAINPATQERIPIWIADYVLASYGTGAIMAVPAHDQRDLDFARMFGLPVRLVYQDDAQPVDAATLTEALIDRGHVVNSGPFTGLPSGPATIDAVIDWLTSQGIGRAHTTYRLHDWLISRQRYWGPPIPMIYCPRDGIVPVPEDQLPVLLPDVEEFRPSGTGQGPLAAVESFVATTCPTCGGPARRETDVSDTFLDSAWYFLRYPSTAYDDRPFDSDLTTTWLPVSMYMGGIEHVRRHHLYARFTTMVLHDLGHIPFAEPFARLRLHGLITAVDEITGDVAKMSKSRGNVVNPDDYIERFGTDALRLYLLFLGPFEEGGAFSDRGLSGITRFMNRVWTALRDDLAAASTAGVSATPDLPRLPMLHRTIKRVTHDIADLKYNTAIAGLMEFTNGMREMAATTTLPDRLALHRTFALLLAPLAPHIAEEMWARLRGQPPHSAQESVHAQAWPIADPAYLVEDTLTLVVQVNGKLRDKLVLPTPTTQADAERLAMASDKVQAALGGLTIAQIIHVPGRLINIVARAPHPDD